MLGRTNTRGASVIFGCKELGRTCSLGTLDEEHFGHEVAWPMPREAGHDGTRTPGGGDSGELEPGPLGRCREPVYRSARQ